ncbi:MAG: pyridoxamine 5'-phosphate oxidase family protein [Lachnospiraceae bacterium]|nr:pyridoxamine 5'-phosphate oxidase family protein [Lachnospiraceae bacterium]MCM1230802.1 pyridoxamine 5'-phosphate oxidase family protein [Ruminococcus flavefaciens]
MNYKMRRTERRLEQAEAENILRENQYGVLSTVGSDGNPYGVPLSYVFRENCLYFHCATEGRKIENIGFCNRASFCVVGKTELLPSQFSTRYESVIAEGYVHELTADEKISALSEIVEKYAPEHREKGAVYIQNAKARVRVFCMEIENLSGKARR